LKEKREVKRTTELRRVFNKNKDTSGYETDWVCRTRCI
jgi:hypothetical protein